MYIMLLVWLGTRIAISLDLKRSPGVMQKHQYIGYTLKVIRVIHENDGRRIATAKRFYELRLKHAFSSGHSSLSLHE